MSTCSDCRFWEFAARDKIGVPWGLCRVAPPVSSSSCVIPQLNLWAGQFPGTRADAWCGAHEPSEQAAQFKLGSPQTLEKENSHG